MSTMWALLCLVAVMEGVHSATVREEVIDDIIAKILASRDDIHFPGVGDHISKKEASREVHFPGEGDVVSKKQEDSSEPTDMEHVLDAGDVDHVNLRKQETEVKRSVKNYEIKMCFMCDLDCQNQIGPTVPVMNTYFDDVKAKVQDMLNTVDPSKFSFSITGGYLKPSVRLGYTLAPIKTRRLRGFELLDHINNNFWSALWPQMGRFGCDVAFLAIDTRDRVWGSRFVGGSVAGVANMKAMCGGSSYGTVRVKSTSASMATLVAHELGHILGMYHDEPDTRYTDSMCTEYETRVDASLGPVCRRIGEACSDVGCPDGSNRCVMNDVVPSGSVSNPKFSACSAAYLDMFTQEAAFQSYMDLSCMEPGSKKRDLSGKVTLSDMEEFGLLQAREAMP